ncbi:hypothetical protein [Phocaeicola vulgatus]
MSSEKRNKLSEIFKLAWQFVKRNGYRNNEPGHNPGTNRNP